MANPIAGTPFDRWFIALVPPMTGLNILESRAELPELLGAWRPCHRNGSDVDGVFTTAFAESYICFMLNDWIDIYPKVCTLQPSLRAVLLRMPTRQCLCGHRLVGSR